MHGVQYSYTSSAVPGGQTHCPSMSRTKPFSVTHNDPKNQKEISLKFESASKK